MNPPKILLIGTGRFGVNHARNWVTVLPKENVFLADVIPGAARAMALQFGIPGENSGEDWKGMLAKVDAVDIVTPTDTHYAIAKEALLSGKDVFCEKPMTMTATETRDLLELAEKHDRILQPGHIYRFHPVTQWIKRHIEAGNLGEVFLVGAEFGGFKRPRYDVGGAFTDGIHFYDLAAYFFGAPAVKVQAITRQYLARNNTRLDDWASVFLEFGNGRIAHICTDYYYAGKKRTMSIVGKKGCIEVDFETKQAVFYRQCHVLQDGIWKAIPEKPAGIAAQISWEEPLKTELESFRNSVATREPPIVTAGDAYALACTVEGIYASSEHRREVEIKY